MMSVAYNRVFTPARELGFALHDVARLLRTYSDQRARELNTTRAQWAVLARLQRCEGVKQSELADALDIAPITLGRLIDKLAAAGRPAGPVHAGANAGSDPPAGASSPSGGAARRTPADPDRGQAQATGPD